MGTRMDLSMLALQSTCVLGPCRRTCCSTTLKDCAFPLVALACAFASFNMSADGDAAAKRLAAEARRQRILAKGKDRLSKITVGAPGHAGDENTEHEAGAVSTHAADASQTDTAAVTEVGSASREAQHEPTAPSTSRAEAEPEHKHFTSSSGQRSQLTARDAEASQQAEQALRQLLNQLAFAEAQPELLGRGQPAAGTSTSSALPLRAVPESASPLHAASSQQQVKAGASTSAPGMASIGMNLPVLPFLGPRLTAAVQHTQLARCYTAGLLAAVLYLGVMTSAQLVLPATVFMVLAQLCLVATAYAYPDLMGTSAAQVVAPSPLPLGVRRFNLLALVPGLSGLVDSLSSASSLAGALSDSVAVFLVTYVLLQTCLGLKTDQS